MASTAAAGAGSGGFGSASAAAPRVVESPLDKQCRIKTSVVARLEKELVRYQEEVIKQSAKVEAMRTGDADEHDVKKQTEVLGEAEMMVPDTMRRLQKAVEDLQEFMVRCRTGSRRSSSPSAWPSVSLIALMIAHRLAILQVANRGAAELAASAHREAAEAALVRQAALLGGAAPEEAEEAI